MIGAASHNRRGRARPPWRGGAWLLVLLAACGQWALAQGQYDSARQSMGPATITTPGLGNRLAPPDFGRVPGAPSPKARIEALPRPASTPAATGTAPTAPATTSGPGATPTAPATPPATDKPTEEPAKPDNPDQVRITGNKLNYTDTGTQVQGKVEIRYQDLTLRGEQAELDKDRVWATFAGPVTLDGKLYKANGEDLRINLDSQIWSIKRSASEVKPDFFSSYVAESLYVRAQEVNGEPARVVGTQGIGTSCDRWPDPHWMLRSNRITYRPGDKVTFAKPTLYLFGYRIIHYPWDLTLSLKQHDNRFLPEVGQNQVEGYYAKFSYGYFLNDENSGFLKLNLTQKRGVGFGIDHILNSASQQGEFSVFAEPAMGSFSGTVTHHEQFSHPFATNLNLSLQQDSGYGIGSTSLNGDLTLRYDTVRTQSLVGFQESLIDTDTSTSSRFSTNFSHQERIGNDGTWALRSTYTASRFASDQPTTEELQTEASWQQQFRSYAVNFLAQKQYELGGQSASAASSYYVLNRTPDLAVNTDSQHLGDRRFFGSGFESTIYLGHFEQYPEGLFLTRGGIDFRLPGHVREFGKRTSLQTSGRFQQMFYSDGSAQWLGDIESQLYQKLTNSWESRLNFSYLRPNGFSPLRTEFYSPTSVLSWEAVRLVPDRMKLDFSFGRDFHNSYYQDAIVRAEIMLTPKNRLELQGGYSPELSQFRPVNFRWIYATAHAWWSAVTLDYDVQQSTLTDTSFDIDWQAAKRWRIQFLGAVSNYGGLNQADVSITRDLHCMLANLTYLKETKEIRFGLGIKAFPGNTRTFGVGAQGQYFESNFGDQY